MAHKIRLGFIDANVRSTWASQPHFPALLASPDIELTAVPPSFSDGPLRGPRHP